MPLGDAMGDGDGNGMGTFCIPPSLSTPSRVLNLPTCSTPFLIPSISFPPHLNLTSVHLPVIKPNHFQPNLHVVLELPKTKQELTHSPKPSPISRLRKLRIQFLTPFSIWKLVKGARRSSNSLRQLQNRISKGEVGLDFLFRRTRHFKPVPY